MRFVTLLVLIAAACGEVQQAVHDAAPDADPCVGVCECRIDSDCAAANTACNDQVTERTCDCSAGYTKGLGGACEFSGIVQDPGFQSAGAWTAGGAALDVNLNEPGMIEPGAARYNPVAMCALARITQTVTMPKRSRADAMVAQLTYRSQANETFDESAAAFGISQSWQDVLPLHSFNFKTIRVCLGAGQYAPEASAGTGTDTVLELMPARLPPGAANCASANSTLDVDRFDIVVANPGECPDPGSAINGDVEGQGGWTFEGFSANGNPFSTTIEPNIGEANSKAVRLFTRNRCSDLTAINTISIPKADVLASPAISIFNKTTATLPGVETTSTLAGVALPAIVATGSPITARVCVPAFMRGSAATFRMGMNLSGTCAEQANGESIIDNLKLVNDPSCGTDANITNPGFESTLPLIGTQSTPGKSLARSIVDATQAHGGSGVLQLAVMQLCDGASWQANIVVPSNGNGGPALKFFYKATPAANYSFTVRSSSRLTFNPTLDNAYHEGTICLDPKLAGRNQALLFLMSGGSGTCAVTHPPEGAFVDDLSVGNDPACPTE